MSDGQGRTPLYDAVRQYAAREVAPFHVPGHKQGKGLPRVIAEFIGSGAPALDIAEIEGIGGLYEPSGVVLEAQVLAAEAFGADHSFFLVNGSTGGVHAMIMAAAGPGQKVAVPRNAHKSVMAGLVLSGATPVYLAPAADAELGLATGVEPATVEVALRRHPDTVAVVVVSPTYYGVLTDVQSIASIVHSLGLPLLVDEAHGAHLKFHPELPVCALDAGADVVVQSVHKTLGSFTQSSILHVRGNRVELERLKMMLRILQTTSASYLLLASLDVARMQAATQGKKLLERTIALAGLAREEINRLDGLRCYGQEVVGRPGIFALDPTKLTINVAGLGLSGPEAERILRYDCHVQVELSEVRHLLAIVTLGDGEEDIRRLVDSLRHLAARHRRSASGPGLPGPPPSIPPQAMTPRDAFLSPSVLVALAEAVGRISSNTVAPYPPGIPILCPGELISRETVDYIEALVSCGIRVQGLAGEPPSCLQVVAD